jgi:FtsH-binding integral membrane protein
VSDYLRRSDPSAELTGIIGQVRRRWRMKLALRGALAVLGLGLLVLLLSAWGLEAWRFTAGAIVAFRIILAITLAALFGWFLVRPLMRRVTDDQVALYLEEQQPSLQAEIVSAMDALRAGHDSAHSQALVRRLVESAVEKCHAIQDGRAVEAPAVRRYAGLLGAVALAALLIFTFGPAFLRHALSALLVVSRGVEAAAPYRIDVAPGDAAVPRGANQTVTAMLTGFDADEATLMVRTSPEAPFDRLPLIRGEAQAYEGILFDLAGPVDYFVEAAGVRSPVFTLTVVDLPYVQRLELEYHFPAYTGLEPQAVEHGGDIAVLRGTEVRVRAFPTMAAPSGQIVFTEDSGTPLTPADSGEAVAAMVGSFKVDKDGFYRIELEGPAGERVAASPQYTIDVLADHAPTVRISKPGRDTTASPIEEVFIEASADDDYGIRNLDLVYSVNGGPEKSVRLFDGRTRMPEVSAGHTFYFEELDVTAGDFVSYYAKATDNDNVAGPKPAMSDMYFVRVRPLSKDFRRAQSDAGGGGGGGGGGGQQNEVGNLSEQQRRIISATFNIQRDRATMTADALREG